MKKLKADSIRTNMQLAVFVGLFFCFISFALFIFFTSDGFAISNEEISLYDLHLILTFFYAGIACLIYRIICWIILRYSKIDSE